MKKFGGKLGMLRPDTSKKGIPVVVKTKTLTGGKKTSMNGPDLSGGGHVR